MEIVNKKILCSGQVRRYGDSVYSYEITVSNDGPDQEIWDLCQAVKNASHRKDGYQHDGTCGFPFGRAQTRGNKLELDHLTNGTLTISTRASAAVDAAKQIQINDDPSRLAAGQFLKILKTLQAEVRRDREDERVSAKATLDAIVAGRNKHLLPLQEAEKIVKAKQIADDDEQNRKRGEEQARIDELQRQEQEAAEEAAMLAAAEIEEAGDVEQAQVIREAPVEVAPPMVVPDMKRKIEGQHTIVLWKCRLVNLDLVPRGLMQFDQVAANRWVAGIKDKLSHPSVIMLGSERASADLRKIDEIAELPNGTVLTKDILGQDIPGIEIFIEKTRASRAY
jgi:hypothetical protein